MFAIEDPEINPVIPEPNIAAFAGPPRIFPTIAKARSKKYLPPPAVSSHQSNLSGQVGWKDKVDADGHRLAPPLNGTGHTWHHDDKTLFYIIKYGLAKLVPKYEGKMMGFGDKLNDKEIKSVLAYVKSFWSNEYYNYQKKLN